jgi:hypothetical protein
VSTPVERACSVWAALEQNGVERLRSLVAEDVEWRPWGNHGRPLIGSEEILEWNRAQHAAGGGSRRVVHQWEDVGGCALASGSLRVFRTGGFLDVQPTWAFFFHGERLQEATCFATREQALAAVEAHAAV